MFKFILITSFLLLGHGVLAQNKITWAINEGLTHQITIANKFASEMKKHNIDVQIKLFPESIEKYHLPMDSNSDYHITQSVSYRYYKKSPKLRVWDVPFLFRSPEHIEKYIQSENAKKILASLETEHEKMLTFTFAGGFLNMITPNKIDSFKELQGKKCQFDDLHLFYHRFLSPLGIQSTTNDFKSFGSICREELTAELNLNDIKHNNAFTFTGHRVIARVLRVSKAALGKLGSKKQLFIDRLKEFTTKERHSVYAEDKIAISFLGSRGLKFYRWSDENKDSQLKSFFSKAYKNLDKGLLKEINFINRLRFTSSMNAKI